MSFKLKFSDLKELWEYAERNCEGSILSINITLDNHLVIKTTDKYADEVTITLYDDSVSYLPKLTKSTRLSGK